MQGYNLLDKTLGHLKVPDLMTMHSNLGKVLVQGHNKVEASMKFRYPRVYIAGLDLLGREDDKANYIEYCKGCRDTVESYHVYVLGFLEPLFIELRDKKALNKGKFLNSN